MSYTASGLIAHCKEAVKNDVQYVYGAKMQVLTYAQIKALQDMYGKNMVWDSDLSKAGKLCCDCSGLISSYTGVSRNSSNYCSTASESATMSQVKANWNNYVGWAFWLSGHIGVVSDTEGYYYAMDGSASNMVHKSISNQKWVKAIKLCDIVYSAAAEAEKDYIFVKAAVKGVNCEFTGYFESNENWVKARALLEALGCAVGWDNSRKKVTADGKVLDVRTWVSQDGVSFCPLREVCESLGYSVSWSKESGIVIV